MNNNLQKKELEEAQKAGIRFYSSPEEKDLAYLKEGMERSDKEKFLFLMNLIKLQRTMKRAKQLK
jgi:hypothetical protein